MSAAVCTISFLVSSSSSSTQLKVTTLLFFSLLTAFSHESSLINHDGLVDICTASVESISCTTKALLFLLAMLLESMVLRSILHIKNLTKTKHTLFRGLRREVFYIHANVFGTGVGFVPFVVIFCIAAYQVDSDSICPRSI